MQCLDRKSVCLLCERNVLNNEKEKMNERGEKRNSQYTITIEMTG